MNFLFLQPDMCNYCPQRAVWEMQSELMDLYIIIQIQVYYNKYNSDYIG